MKKNDWEVFYLELIEAKKYLDYVINSIEVKDIVNTIRFFPVIVLVVLNFPSFFDFSVEEKRE